MKRLWASLCCLTLLFAVLDQVPAFVGDSAGESASVATLASEPAGQGEMGTPAGGDHPGCADEADGAASSCTLNAIIAPCPLVAPASIRRLANRREAAASLKRNAPTPEPPPPIAVS